MEDMTGFRASTADGRTVEDVTPADLRPLLTEDVEFVIFESAERGPDQFVQATRSDGAWHVEVRRGSDADHLGAGVPNADAVFDVMRSWANDDGWWVDAFTWVQRSEWESSGGFGNPVP